MSRYLATHPRDQGPLPLGLLEFWIHKSIWHRYAEVRTTRAIAPVEHNSVGHARLAAASDLGCAGRAMGAALEELDALAEDTLPPTSIPVEAAS